MKTAIAITIIIIALILLAPAVDSFLERLDGLGPDLGAMPGDDD